MPTMRHAFALASLFTVVVALRKDGGVVKNEEEAQIDDSIVSHNSAEADSVMGLSAGVVLRERYILEVRIVEPVSDLAFPQIARRRFDGPVEHVSTGSFGDTWQAYDVKLGKLVAVKIFYDGKRKAYVSWANATARQKLDLDRNARDCKRVQQWMESSGRSLGANRICQCYAEHISDATPEDSYLFVVLEFCGKDLGSSSVTKALSKARGLAFITKVRDIIKGVLEGLAFITNLSPPVIHHDLKPEHVAVAPEGQVKLMDWTNAVNGEKDNIGASCVWTTDYAAPELLEGKGCFSFPVHSYDIYSAGLMYMQLLCPQVSSKTWMSHDEWTRRSTYVPLDQASIYTMLTHHCTQLRGVIEVDVALIAEMVSLNPAKRPTPSAALKSPQFKR